MAKERQTERRRLEDEQKRNARKEVFSWVRMFAIVIVVVFVLTQFIIINAKIPSGSMENTIMTHDRLIGFRFAYWFEEPQRGDIILFEYPVDETQIYIKRVIGLPGETVEIRDGHIYIDGSEKPLEEDYLKETWRMTDIPLKCRKAVILSWETIEMTRKTVGYGQMKPLRKGLHPHRKRRSNTVLSGKIKLKEKQFLNIIRNLQF